MAEETGVTDTAESVQSDKTESARVETGSELSMTQEDVDRVVESRLARERRKFADYDDLKQKASAYDEAVESSKSEIQKIQEENARLQEAVSELTDANSYVAARTSLLQEVAKPEYNIVDPEGAIEFLMGADWDLLEVDEEDGLPTNIGSAVQKLVEKRSYLVRAGESTAPSNVDQGARGGGQIDQLSEGDLENMTPREIVEARNEGRLDKILQGDQ